MIILFCNSMLSTMRVSSGIQLNSRDVKTELNLILNCFPDI